MFLGPHSATCCPSIQPPISLFICLLRLMHSSTLFISTLSLYLHKTLLQILSCGPSHIPVLKLVGPDEENPTTPNGGSKTSLGSQYLLASSLYDCGILSFLEIIISDPHHSSLDICYSLPPLTHSFLHLPQISYHTLTSIFHALMLLYAQHKNSLSLFLFIVFYSEACHLSHYFCFT